MIDMGPTDESIARAKAARDAERRDIERATGIRISESGKPAATIIHCMFPGCQFSASARVEGRALRSLGCHLVAKHGQRV
jgi:hypothetical protein